MEAQSLPTETSLSLRKKIKIKPLLIIGHMARRLYTQPSAFPGSQPFCRLIPRLNTTRDQMISMFNNRRHKCQPSDMQTGWRRQETLIMTRNWQAGAHHPIWSPCHSYVITFESSARLLQLPCFLFSLCMCVSSGKIWICLDCSLVCL